MDNYMVKRYPCRDYKRLLAAEALPMTGEFTIKADLERFFYFYHYKPIKAHLRLKMYLFQVSKKRKLAKLLL